MMLTKVDGVQASMPEVTDVQLLRDQLTERLSRLRELHGRGLISRDILSGQIMEILGSAESRRLWEITMKPDMTARRLLARLEDPARWRRESSMPAEQRLALLKERLAVSMMEKPMVDSAVLDSLLETASLPHYASFIPSSDSGPRIERAGVELSVLD
jgi:hypothetical protein